MNRSLSWKIGFIVVVIGFSIWMLYPLKEKINLGLDLKGGMHLILQVKTDDAIAVQTDTSATQL